jgi:hypothetical protein
MTRNSSAGLGLSTAVAGHGSICVVYRSPAGGYEGEVGRGMGFARAVAGPGIGYAGIELF